MFEHLDKRAQRVIDLAQHEARALDHPYLGTEHLLVGLASAGGSVAALLADRNCGPEDIRAEILTLIGRGHPATGGPDALLATLGIDLGQVRQRVEATFGPDAVSRVALRTRPRRRWLPGQRWWPGCERGRPCHSALLGAQWLGLAPRVKKVLDIAVRRSAPARVSPEQLLLAVLEEGKGVACQVLSRRGIDLVELTTSLHSADIDDA